MFEKFAKILIECWITPNNNKNIRGRNSPSCPSTFFPARDTPERGKLNEYLISILNTILIEKNNKNNIFFILLKAILLFFIYDRKYVFRRFSSGLVPNNEN